MDVNEITCPQCNKRLKAVRKAKSRSVACPKCGYVFEIPGICNDPPQPIDAKELGSEVAHSKLVSIETPPVGDIESSYGFFVYQDGRVEAKWRDRNEAIEILEDITYSMDQAKLGLKMLVEQQRQIESSFRGNSRATGPSYFGIGRGKSNHILRLLQVGLKTLNGLHYSKQTQEIERQRAVVNVLLANLSKVELDIKHWLRMNK